MSSDADIGGRDEDSLLVAEHVLGLLDAGSARDVARRIRTEPEMARHALFWQTRLAAFDEQFEEHAPPADAFAAIERRLYGASAQPSWGWWNNLALWRSLAAAGLVVAVLSIGSMLLRPAPLAPEEFATQLVAALEAQENSGVQFVALYDPRQGAVRLVSLSGQPPADRDYELWAIQGEAAPVSVGIVAIEGRSEMPLPSALGQNFGEGTVLAVSVEPKGGSPSGAPTGPIVAKGPATPI